MTIQRWPWQRNDEHKGILSASPSDENWSLDDGVICAFRHVERATTMAIPMLLHWLPMTFVASPCLICAFSEPFEALGEINILPADSSTVSPRLTSLTVPEKCDDKWNDINRSIVFHKKQCKKWISAPRPSPFQCEKILAYHFWAIFYNGNAKLWRKYDFLSLSITILAVASILLHFCIFPHLLFGFAMVFARAGVAWASSSLKHRSSYENQNYCDHG
jgi:hypothetical protein